MENNDNIVFCENIQRTQKTIQNNPRFVLHVNRHTHTQCIQYDDDIINKKKKNDEKS